MNRLLFVDREERVEGCFAEVAGIVESPVLIEFAHLRHFLT